MNKLYVPVMVLCNKPLQPQQGVLLLQADSGGIRGQVRDAVFGWSCRWPYYVKLLCCILTLFSHGATFLAEHCNWFGVVT